MAQNGLKHILNRSFEFMEFDILTPLHTYHDKIYDYFYCFSTLSNLPYILNILHIVQVKGKESSLYLKNSS